MTTCDEGDSFYLDASITYDAVTTLEGCYSDSGDTNWDLPEYVNGGVIGDGLPAVVAFENDVGSTVS